MKTLLTRLTAAASSVMLAVYSAGAFTVFAEETETAEPATYTIHFDYDEEGVSIAEDEDGNVPEINDIVTEDATGNFIPMAYLEKEGYEFSCWTIDGIRGYLPGDIVRTEGSDITLKPVWVLKKDAVKYEFSYSVVIDGEEVDTSKTLPAPFNVPVGKLLSLSEISFPRDGYKQRGWTDGTNDFAVTDRFIMPAHDVQLTPVWKQYHNLIYSPGDVDRLISTGDVIFEYVEGFENALPAADRFSRYGFKIIGWHSSYDDKDYGLYEFFTMPDEDITFYAIWEPMEYNVAFLSGTGSSKDNILIKAVTDDVIEVPEIGASKDGYTFTGWSYTNPFTNEKTVYQPGDEFTVLGAKPGVGIGLTAVWVKSDEVTTTTTQQPESKITYGDATGDGEIKVNDAVLIMQALANPDKYGVKGSDKLHITEDGWANADCYETGDGVTGRDAMAIQMYTLQLVTKFPVTAEDITSFE